jgi:chromosome segregation ATPase
MADLESLRRERYRVAQSIFDGSFGSAREQKLMDAVLVESGRMADLENEYADARATTTELLGTVEKSVAKTEEAAQQAANEVNRLQTAIETYKRTHTRMKNTTGHDAQRDTGTYATATTLLEERIGQAQRRLEELQAVIESYEPKPFLSEPQAQELYLQLRALLTAQEKDLRALLRPFNTHSIRSTSDE